MRDKYYFGICDKCGKFTSLKNGICPNCKDNLPDFMKEFFKEKEK